MNKFTKISATALLALFLAACDNAETEKAETSKAETVTVQAVQDNDNPDGVVDVQGAVEFYKVYFWGNKLAKLFEDKEILSLIRSKDEDDIEDGFEMIRDGIDDGLEELDDLNVKNAEVNAYRAKIKELFGALNELTKEQEIVAINELTRDQEDESTIQAHDELKNSVQWKFWRIHNNLGAEAGAMEHKLIKIYGDPPVKYSKK